MKALWSFTIGARNTLRFYSRVLPVVAWGVMVLAPARSEAKQSAQAGVLVTGDLPVDPAHNVPDPNALLIHPLDQMRANPHWRLYAAVVTHDHATLQALLDAGDSPNGFGNNTGLPLVMACQIGDLESVSALMKSGANVNLFWHGGTSPLIAATEFGHPDIVRYLLAHGAQPNEGARPTGVSALFAALNHRDFAILTLLIEGGADVNLPNNGGGTLLMIAALSNDQSLVNFLKDHGARFGSGDEELFYSAATGEVQGIERLIAAGAKVNRPFERGVTPLMAAALNGQTSAVKALIAHGAHINAFDEVHDTALMFALKGAHKSTVLALLDSGADPTLEDIVHETTLHRAASSMDDPEIVHRLIAAGVSPSAGDSIAVTPLMYAAAFGHLETVKILVEAHVPVNVQSQEGLTALMEGATAHRPEIINVLLRAGADPSIRDKQNRTALDDARWMHDDTIVAILEKNSPESLVPSSSATK